MVIPDPLLKVGTPLIVSAAKTIAGEVIGDSEEVKRLLGTMNKEVLDLQKKFKELKLSPESPRESDPPYSKLVKELAEFCYDVDDVKDDVYLTEMMRPNSSQQTIFEHTYRFFTHGDIDTKALQSLTKNPNLIKRMKELVENRMPFLKLQAEQNSQKNSNHNNDGQELPDSLALPDGRKKEEQKIIQKLLVDDSNYGVSLIGMGGLGKTMLARSIVEDQRVRNKFGVIKWASESCIRNKSDPIILYPKSQRAETSTSSVVDTKTLLVLDGLENDPCEFIERHGEVVLLITTRDKISIQNTRTATHYLNRMSKEDCKELIKIEVEAAAFSVDDQTFFETRAINLAEKCMGLPLIATILGRAVCARARCPTNEVRDAIRHFEANQLWELLGAKIICELSFNDKQLASHLNKLAYFTLFPKKHPFDKVGLVLLWIAEGFIQPADDSIWELTPHFDVMLPISMVEPCGFEDGYPSSYKTNEIVHRIAQSIYGNLCLREDIGGDTCLSHLSGARHLSLCFQDIPETLFDRVAENVSRLRTFLLLHESGTNINKVPHCLLEKSLCLRVLSLSRSCIKTVPKSISNLKHLRYLDLSDTKILKLPDSICKLFFLVYLKLIKCTNLTSLPREIGELVNLTHLELGISCSLPKSVGNLKKLQYFHEFSVERNAEWCCITELKELNLLQGSLRIRNLENVMCVEEASGAELDKKKYLTTLFLEWGHSSTLKPQDAQLDILTNLPPPSSLLELRVTNYAGIRLPAWICTPKSLLKTIHLYNCPYVSELPQFWKLPYLDTLRIENLSGVSSMGRQFFGDQANTRFKSLKCLQVFDMENLASFEGLLPGDMSSLSTLIFESCSKLATMSTLRDLLKLTVVSISYCPRLSGYEPKLPPEVVYIFFGDDEP